MSSTPKLEKQEEAQETGPEEKPEAEETKDLGRGKRQRRHKRLYDEEG